MPTDDLHDLLRRVRRLEAIRAIEQLKYRYLRACDRKDPDAFRDCFVRSGADIDYGPVGRFNDREGLVEVFSQVALAHHGDGWLVHDVHHGKHPSIELIDDQTASGEWTLWFMQINRLDASVTQVSMEYRDRYIVDDGEWKIASTHVTPMTTLRAPMAEGAFTASIPLR
ncbi:nuclear transport factor 2 family protein [Solimonas marina]|uniref:Nuclear transport factor 2 family protein n=1 Tax=Solimonas marina TaxID=2714601 RepID=A0A970B589_9GAMM|nr:nuclear transport factor 2 family protein [Solimonas marina]NKF21443.1 nuclear transport factor 2 family protein [Solimonas marina]